MTRTVNFRYRVVRNGADYCELSAAGVPRVSMDTDNSIKTRFSGTFLLPEEAVDWLTDEIRPVMVIDGTEHSLGIFAPVSVSEAETATMKTVHIDAFDRCWFARDHRIEQTICLPAGTGYLGAVGSLLAECGIGLVFETPTAAVLAEDRADWTVGTSSLDIINQLLAEINYMPLYFDGDGVAILRPKATATASDITQTMDDTQIESLILPGISRGSDFHATPNVYICVCSNPDKEEPMVSVAENTNPQSPLSIARRGRRITQMVTVNNIASQEELDVYAQRLVTDSMLTGEVIELQTCLLPGYGVGDVVGLRYGDIFAVCREKSWSMELKVGGRMSHTLERVVLNID